jgi:hypothetical protein
MALGAKLPEAVEEVAPEATDVADATAAPAETAPETGTGTVQQVLKGKQVAQPGAQAAVRGGVQASTEAAGTADESMAANIQSQPVLSGNTSVVDEPLSALKDSEVAAYSKMDEVAGFDVKAEKAQLSNDQYNLKQLGNTEADAATRDKLTASIEDSQSRIADAESKMQDAGIDPKAADTIHQQRMAGQDFKKALVQNTAPDGSSINVDGLLKASKSLRFSKYGDRLAQFMGKDGADAYMANLQKMQELGAHAVTTRKVAAWLAGAIGVPGALGTAYAGVSHLLGGK